MKREYYGDQKVGPYPKVWSLNHAKIGRINNQVKRRTRDVFLITTGRCQLLWRDLNVVVRGVMREVLCPYEVLRTFDFCEDLGGIGWWVQNLLQI